MKIMLADHSGRNCSGSASALRLGFPCDELIVSSRSVADILSASPLQASLCRQFQAFTLCSPKFLFQAYQVQINVKMAEQTE